jgi:hypothetical protein
MEVCRLRISGSQVEQVLQVSHPILENLSTQKLPELNKYSIEASMSKNTVITSVITAKKQNKKFIKLNFTESLKFE